MNEIGKILGLLIVLVVDCCEILRKKIAISYLIIFLKIMKHLTFRVLE